MEHIVIDLYLNPLRSDAANLCSDECSRTHEHRDWGQIAEAGTGKLKLDARQYSALSGWFVIGVLGRIYFRCDPEGRGLLG